MLYDVKSHALDQLRVIRETMERAAAFTALPGWGGVAMGVSALAAGAFAPATPSPRWMAIWLLDAAAAFAIGLAATIHKARRTHTALSGAPARRFALAFAPGVVAAVVLTIVIAHAGRLEWLAPCWLLLYGAAVCSGGALSAGPVPLMGVTFMMLGAAAFAAPGSGPALMIVGFGVVQIGFGIWIGVRYGG